jgi:hypothetical protein
MRLQIEVVYAVMAPVSERATGSVASGGLENCCWVDEHMHTADLFLNNFLKLVNFLCNFCLLNENSGCLNTR